MSKCGCRSLDELVKELTALWVTGENDNVAAVIDEISGYSLSTAITLSLEVYKALPESNKESFLNAFSIRM